MRLAARGAVRRLRRRLLWRLLMTSDVSVRYMIPAALGFVQGQTVLSKASCFQSEVCCQVGLRVRKE